MERQQPADIVRIPIMDSGTVYDDSAHEARPPEAELVTVGSPDTVIFLGIGNEGPCLTRMARLLLAQQISDVAIVGGLPYDRAPATREGLEGMAMAGAVTVGRYLREQFPVVRLHGIAESQAAPSLTYAALAAPEVFDGRVGLHHPIGIKHLESWQFVVRMSQGAFQADQALDWRSPPIAARTAWRTFQDILDGGHRLRMGLTTDIRTSLPALAAAKGDDLLVVAADRDRIFPPHVYRSELAALGLERLLRVQSGAHSSPGIKAGARQVAQTIRWCRSGVWPESA